MSETATLVQIPAPGQPWPEQGGIYVGARVIDGVVHHRIIPGGTDQDIVASHNNAAERIAATGEINGFSDWTHGDQRDLMLAYINAPDLFHRGGIESVQITSTPYGSFIAWAVDFESGSVSIFTRDGEFRVRPFRSFIP
ncbi:hypothetical protein H0A73_21685 [Alcaligenaceae bacterium]|nr:hypothetical protein [Alcaligenaceae bacterium]